MYMTCRSRFFNLPFLCPMLVSVQCQFPNISETLCCCSLFVQVNRSCRLDEQGDDAALVQSDAVERVGGELAERLDGSGLDPLGAVVEEAD